jgi:acetyl-CoA acetyltransferase
MIDAMVEPWQLRDRTAVVGIGRTGLSKDSGVSTLTLATTAIRAAVADAGLRMADIDGIATHGLNDSAPPQTVSRVLGMHDVTWFLDEYGGGSKSHAIIGQAILACAGGAARTIVVYRSMNGRSGLRMGGSGPPPMPAIENQYEAPYGLVGAPQHYALLARAHMAAYGTTQEHFGHVAVQQRANASMNPLAVMREPITMGDYLSSRWSTEPFKIFDCSMETDGACAAVITTAERAGDLRAAPVYLAGAAWGIGRNFFSTGTVDLTTSGAATLAPMLYRRAGLGPADIDVAEIYDCFSYTVLAQLEDYGFCAKGEGGPFVASGATALAGRLPVNTHGGFLSEGYVHGLNHFCEAVTQLRGEAGERQVPGCQVALSTGQPGYTTGLSAAVVMHT